MLGDSRDDRAGWGGGFGRRVWEEGGDSAGPDPTGLAAAVSTLG